MALNAFESVLFVVGYCTDDAARVAGGKDSFRDIACDYRASGNDCAAADSNSRHNGHHTTDPNIVADCYRQGILDILAADLLVERMPGGVEAALRSDENIVPDFDGSFV